MGLITADLGGPEEPHQALAGNVDVAFGPMLPTSSRAGRHAMRDGLYNLSLSADGYTGSGHMNLTDNSGQGHDGKFKVELHLQGQGPKLSGIANVLMSPHVVHNSRMPEHYSLNMTGTEADDAFSLIGIGPLGLIVEIRANRVNA